MTSSSAGDTFVQRWNELDRRERLHVRRLVRIGAANKVDDPELAAGYARFQLVHPAMRYFWVWFVPGILIALGLAASIHPVLVGAVIALGAQAVLTRRNLRRAL